MLKTIDKRLNVLYKFSGYIAAFFLILVAVFILIGISSRIFGFYIRGLAEYSGYCMASASFFALAYTFVEGDHIRITLFLEKFSGSKKRIIEIWCLSLASFFFRISSILLYQNAYYILQISGKKRGCRRDINMDTSNKCSFRFDNIFCVCLTSIYLKYKKIND